MVIAVNTRFLVNGEREEYASFIHETFSRITSSQPGHTFIFIFDRPPALSYVFPPNVVPVVTRPQARHPAQWYIWYNIKVPAVLKRYKADVFVSPDGSCSLTARIPQCLVVYDLAFLQGAPFMARSHFLFYKKFTPRFIKKAAMVVTLSQFTRAAIVKYYKTGDDKIEVIYTGVTEKFISISIEEREAVKTKYAGGNEYFIYSGDIVSDKNLVNLLKAFSAFKKRQKSSMQLVITGTPGWKYEEFLESLRLFRFRDDVKLLANPSPADLIEITAAAYAMVYPSLPRDIGTQALQAMKSGVPVITSPATAISEICGDAALYADPDNFKEIAVQMMLIFKDENLRSTLIEKGKLLAEGYGWNKTAGLFWNVIAKTMKR